MTAVDSSYDDYAVTLPALNGHPQEPPEVVQARAAGWMPYAELPYRVPGKQQGVAGKSAKNGATVFLSADGIWRATDDAVDGRRGGSPFGWYRWELNTAPDPLEPNPGSVNKRIQDLTVDKRAKDVIAYALRKQNPLPYAVSLRELLEHPPEPVKYRINQWLPIDGRVVCAASQKAGKTTLVGNVARALVDGDAFLGAYTVEPVVLGNIAIIDNEMSTNMLADWYREMQIKNSGHIQLWPLRGQGAAFDILTPAVRAEWVAKLRGIRCTVLVLDCLSPALGALGLTESNEDLMKFLPALDALKLEAGIGELLVMHHHGHQQERSRGGSRLRGWPDVEWHLLKDRDAADNEIDTGARFISAVGRVKDVSESKLSFDPATRRLRFVGGTRQQSRADQHVPTCVAIIREEEEQGGGGMLKTALKKEIGQRCGLTRGEDQAAVVNAAERLNMITHTGSQGQGMRYTLITKYGA